MIQSNCNYNRAGRCSLLTCLLLFCLLLFGQKSVNAQSIVTVQGIVYNDHQQPLEGASVTIKGTEHGTATGSDGHFSIQAAEGAVLKITHVGYQVLELAVSPNITAVLQPEKGSLSEVVVIGYGTQQKKELTGAIATVNADDFQQGSITSPEQLIAGKVAGVSITSNGGSPGAGSVIRIRGGASIQASNNPLIVIDGVPLSGNNIYGASNPLSLINPGDIASFTILKDAAATAIYGSRASNGVIIITTKKGKGGSPVIQLNSQLSVSKIAKQVDVLSADQFRQYVDSLGQGSYDGTHTYASLMGTANTNWQNQIYQSALSTDNSLSITGALKHLPYRISAAYLNQDGILRTDNLQRVTGSIALTPTFFNDKLKVSLNLNGTSSHTRFANNAAISSSVYFDPTQPVYDENSPYGGYYEWSSVDANTQAVTLNKLAPRNPLALLELYKNLSDVQRSYGNLQLDYALPFVAGLHANLNLGYDVAKGSGTIDVPAMAAQNYLDGGQKNRYSNKINNKVLEFYLNYNKDLEKIKSNINVIAGYGYYSNESTNDNYPNIRANGDTIAGSEPAFPMDKPTNVLLSYYGRLIYTYNTRYILSASLRKDGSSRFAPDTRWGVFPSLAFTWRINQEAFLKSASSLSDLKLRLSYGVTGNQDGIYDYPYQSIYSYSSNASKVQFGDTYYNMATPAAYDAGIKWEQTATYNAGLDYGFWDNRITGSLDFYFKKTKDLLNTIPIPAGSNFSSTILTNVGNIENKGVEFAISAALIRQKRIQWNAGFNVAYNNNKITNLTATKDSTYAGTMTGNGVIQINSVGYNTNAFYVYHQQYDQNGKPIEGVYADINGDGIINQDDLYRYKSPFPKFTFGFSTDFTLGKWTLSTVLRANLGNYMYNNISTGAIRSNILNPLGYLAGVVSDVLNTGFKDGQGQSDYYIQNASFLKMDNLGLSYNVGKIFKNKVALSLQANCQNVFTVTKYTGLDPEIYGGIDNVLYPRPRIYSLSLHASFL